MPLYNPAVVADHDALTGVSANDHHNQAHAIDGADHTSTLDHGALGGLTDDDHTQYLKEADFDDVDFLVGTATAHTGAEIVVGTTPGGELGGTWASPTVDATHAGSTHVAIAGPVPRAIQTGASPAAVALATAINLPANGGSIAVHMAVEGPMNFDSVRVRNTDTTLARAWRWDLYKQNGATNTLDRVAASNGSESFTAAAASVRTLAATSAPVAIDSGGYWLVLQSTHATNAFGVGSTAATALATTAAQTKTTTNPNGATLDFTAATWTKSTAHIAVVMDGRVFGQAAAF